MRTLILAVIALITATSVYAQNPNSNSNPLSLEQFLGQVGERHEGLKAATEISTGAQMRSEEGSLIFRPSLSGSVSFSRDQSPPASAFQSTRTITNNLSLGISQQTRFGLGAKLSYNITEVSQAGVPIQFLPLPDFYRTGPVLELSFPLLRNRFASEYKALEALQNAAALASAFGQAFFAKQLIAEAEGAYWRLALAREAVALQTESLERAEKIQGWNARRARLELADRSDLLQADAAVLSRKLELQLARDEEKSAARAFNLARGQESDVVSERLAPFAVEKLAEVSRPVRGGSRDDLKAAEQQQKVAEAQARSGMEKAMPSLDLFATIGLNGLDQKFSESLPESLSVRYPQRTVGLRMNVPLDFGTASDIRAGYERERIAADLNVSRRALEEKRTWSDLSIRFDDAQARFKLAREIEKAQREKLEFERKKLDRGRTTTYQVLLFEQDLSFAQLSRIRTQSELLGIAAQLKTFVQN